MKVQFKPLLFAAASSIVLLASQAAAAELSGRVTADTSGTSLAGADVEIVELGLKTRTNTDGSYRFANVPAGKYTLRITYAGGKATEQKVEASQSPVTADVSIEGAGSDEKVVVTGQRGRLASAVSRQRAADGVQSVATRDSIGQFPDQNAAEAVRRLPGVNVLNDQGEGRFVSVRGLDPNLNSASINGVRTPSPEADIRAVALDVVSSDLIESVEVKKTLTPDMDADTIGASIEINTVSTLTRKKPYFGAVLEGSYNDYTNQWSPKIGSDFSTRLTDTLGVAGGVSFSRRNFETDNIEADGWNEDGGIVYVSEIEYRDYDVIRERLGGSLGFDWKATDNTTLFARGVFSRFDDQEYRRRTIFDMEDAVPVSGTATTASFDSDLGGERFTVIRDIKDRFERQEIVSLSAGGKTFADLWRFDYALSYSKASEEEDGSLDPGRYRQRFSGGGASRGTVTFDYSDKEKPSFVFGVGAANFVDPTRYTFYRLEETDLSLAEDTEWSAKADATRTFSLGDGTFDLKFGAKARLREKTNELEINYFDSFAGGLNMSGVVGPATYRITTIDPVPGKTAFGNFYAANSASFGLSDLDTEFESNVADYSVEEDIFAGYLMGRYERGPLTAIGGVRVEHTKNDVAGKLVELVEAGATFGGVVLLDDTVFVTPVQFEQTYTDWLPSALVRFEARDDLVLRAGVFRSIVRPNIGDIAPRFIVEEDDGDVREGEFGNPDLDPYRAWNFDASAEWYFAREAVVSAGVFYKNVKDFIVKAEFSSGVFNGIAYDEAIIPINGDEATIKGFEFNYQQSLIFLPKPFDGLLASFNYTYTDAEGDVLGRTIPLPASSKHTYTGLIGYENGPLSLRVAATYRDKYLDELGGGPDEDRYVADHLQFDFTGKYAVTDNLKLVLELVNANDATYFAYQNSYGGERLLQFEEYSWTGKVGIRYSN